MSENTNPIRTTTINLYEYDQLKSSVESKDREIGALEQNIQTLKEQLEKKEEKEPLVKVVHCKETEDYDSYNDTNYTREITKYTEFINLDSVKTLIKEALVEEGKDKTKELEAQIDDLEINNKILKKQRTSFEDLSETTLKEIKNKVKSLEEDKKELKENNVKREKELQKAYNADVDAYKETIKELKESIQKIKENKTDKELEAKRNEEIKSLKVRIKELERILTDLENTSFIKRIFKLRAITHEQNVAAQELAQKKIDADKVGVTTVRENGKLRKYDSFKERLREKFAINLDHFFYGRSSNAIMSAGMLGGR